LAQTNDPLLSIPSFKNNQYFQQAVLDGYGWFLKDQSSRLSNVNKFLRKVPEFQEKIDTIHDMTIRGDINRLKALMDRRGWAQGKTKNRKPIIATTKGKAIYYL
jgi:hypothetical protein